MCVRTRTCVRWRLSLQEQRCGGQRPGERSGQSAARVEGGCGKRDAGREEETGGGREVCMCVVVSLCTCIGARAPFV